jgi:hypothetical protein
VGCWRCPNPRAPATASTPRPTGGGWRSSAGPGGWASRWGRSAICSGPAEAHSTEDIVTAAKGKLGAINKQIGELALLGSRLRRLVQVCEHGDGDDCVALRLEELEAGEMGR